MYKVKIAGGLTPRSSGQPLLKSAKLGPGWIFDPLCPQPNSGTQSLNCYTELLNLVFVHLVLWIPYLSHLKHFSQTKFTKLRSSILSGTTTSSPHLPPAFKPPELLWFYYATFDKLYALSSSSPDTSGSNPYLTLQTMKISNLFFTQSQNVINLSLPSGVFFDQFNSSFSQKIQPWQRKPIQLHYCCSSSNSLLQLLSYTYSKLDYYL